MDTQSVTRRSITQPLANALAAAGIDTPVTRTAKLTMGRRGYWQISYSEPGPGGAWRTQTVSTRTKDRAAADGELRRFLRNEASVIQQNHVDNMNIAELCGYYITHHAAKKGRSASKSLTPVISALGDRLPRDLTPQLIDAYRRVRTVKDGTVRRELGSLVAALNYCEAHKLITRDNNPRIDLPPVSPPRVVHMNDQQERKFWDSAMGYPDSGLAWADTGWRIKITVALALETAARIEAIEELTWDRVNFDLGLIDFRVPDRSVTNKRRAVVPISERLLPVLLDYRPADRSTARVIGRGQIRRLWRRFAGQIDMQWVTPHVCRHTWATMAVHDGVSLTQVAKMLGDTTQTVERNYVHFQPEHLRSVVNRRRY